MEYIPIYKNKNWSPFQILRFITETFHRLIETLAITKTRYLYPSFHPRNRLTGLVGPRGVGKTTLLLQFIKNELFKDGKCFYFSADLIYFQQINLLEFVKDLHTIEGYNIVFIDEIHRYQGWNQELKNLYDSFPSLKIVFSGSSMLDLVGGSHDLSRRAKLYQLHGLSFREYLNFTLDLNLAPIPFEQILKDPTSCLPALDRIIPHFEEYLRTGYYPFALEDPHSYYEKLGRVINKTIFEDIANSYNLKTQNLPYFTKLLSYLASIPPGDINFNTLAKHLGLDHKTVEHYISILSSVGLVREIHPYETGSAILRKPCKIFLNNTNLLHAILQYLDQSPPKGLERELFFLQSLQNAGIQVFHSKQGDFRTKKAIFEIGGKNKTRSQLQGVEEPTYLVKDNILHPLKGEIPLYLLGFLY